LINYQSISLEIVDDLESWDRAEEVPTGSREKMTLIRRDDGKHHVFKFPKDRREHQIWSELIASYIAGDLLSWDVQHVGIGLLEGRPGNLLGYIFEPGRKELAQESFIEGWSLCTQVDPDFDVKRGTRHTLPLLLNVHEHILEPALGVSRQDFMTFWAKAFALDALISNTDRHAENWAVTVSQGKACMAALYDNGTSMGCGLDQIGLDRCFDKGGRIKLDHLQRHQKKGRHHVRLAEPARHGAAFEEICSSFLKVFPEGRSFFEAAEAVDLDRVVHLMCDLQHSMPLPTPYLLSERRKQHIYAILQLGVERIRNTLCK
jgi:hypothetical protein